MRSGNFKIGRNQIIRIPIEKKRHFELPLKINHKASQTLKNFLNIMRNIPKK